MKETIEISDKSLVLLQRQYEDVQRMVLELQSQKEFLEGVIVKLEEREIQLSETTQKIERNLKPKQSTFDKLTEEIEQLEKEMSILAEKKKTVSELFYKETDLIGNIKIIEHDTIIKKAILSDIEIQREKLDIKMLELQTNIKNMSLERSKLEKGIESLLGEKEMLTSEINEKKEEVKNLKVEKQILEIKTPARVEIIKEEVVKYIDDKKVQIREEKCLERENALFYKEKEIEDKLRDADKRRKDSLDLEKGLRIEKEMFEKQTDEYLKKYLLNK